MWRLASQVQCEPDWLLPVSATLIVLTVLVGLAFLHPAWTFKLIILIFFVMLTNPVSSHALARAAHAIGIFETETTVIDQLAASRDETASGENSMETDK